MTEGKPTPQRPSYTPWSPTPPCPWHPVLCEVLGTRRQGPAPLQIQLYWLVMLSNYVLACNSICKWGPQKSMSLHFWKGIRPSESTRQPPTCGSFCHRTTDTPGFPPQWAAPGHTLWKPWTLPNHLHSAWIWGLREHEKASAKIHWQKRKAINGSNIYRSNPSIPQEVNMTSWRLQLTSGWGGSL